MVARNAHLELCASQRLQEAAVQVPPLLVAVGRVRGTGRLRYVVDAGC